MIAVLHSSPIVRRVRKWLRRSRALRPGKPLVRKTALKRASLQLKPDPERAQERFARHFGPEGYRAWLLTHSCAACGNSATDQAHVRSRGAGGTWTDTVPMCRSCHVLQHTKGWRPLWEATGRSRDDLAAAAKAFAAQWASHRQRAEEKGTV